MPYSSTQGLPKSVRDRYSSRCQRAFMHAFNSTHEKTGDEGRAMASGHAAAQRCEGSKTMDDIMTTQAIPSARFDIFTGILKAGGGDGEPMTLSGVASSSVEDLHGDHIERSALKDMEKQIATGGLAIFLNHSYKVPEDVAGYSSSGKIAKRGEDAEGNAVWDLDIEIEINDENPRAVEAWRGIQKKKAKIGLSIGANIPPGGYEEDRKTGAKTIKHINLLETSMVGIPANPRSWIAKALESLTPSDPLPLSTNGTGTVVFTLTPEEVEGAPPADDRDIEPELLEACPTCGKGRNAGGCDDGYHKQTSPDQPDTSIQDDSEPEAVSSDPGPEESLQADPSEVAPLESDTAAIVLESLDQVDGEVTATHLQSAVDIGLALVAQVTKARAERDAALTAQAEAERERDEVIERTGRILADTAQVIEAVGDMPLGRKTAIREQGSKISHLVSVYGTEFMKMLEK